MAMQKDGLEILTFKTQKEWADWLEKNHMQQEGVWLRLFKKSSGVTGISYMEAVEEALIYGWIDAVVNKYDDKSYLQRFTPRRKKSIWSKINIGKVEALIKLGKMKPSGLKEVEVAKADGRWERAYDSPSTMEIPKDFLEELKKHKKAEEYFKTLSKSNLFFIGFRLQTAKKEETKARRIKVILEMLERGEKFN